MRKLIIATAALAFLSSTAFAQSTDKAGGTTTVAQGSDTMSKGDASKDKMSKKSKKSKKSSDDTTKQ
jgi:predicted outer membrane protein